MRRSEVARERVRDLMRVPLLRNGYSLVGSIAATAALGMAFWFVAAHAYSTADVGLATALISTMQLLSGLSQLNLTTAFNRFVPTAGRTTRRLVLIGYGITVALSAVAAIVFVVGTRAGAWTPKLVPLLAHSTDAVLFVLAVMMWTIFTLEDAVLTGLGDTPWVLVENVIYGILKLALLWIVASHLPHTGIFIAWTLPLVVCIVGVNQLLFARLIPKRDGAPDEAVKPGAIVRFASADYVSALLATATSGLIPIIVLSIAGKDATAYVFIAFTISYALFQFSLAIGQSMITEVAQAPERIVEYARRTVKHCLVLVVPSALGLCVLAPFVLRIFGADYAAHATHLLQLFALSAIPGVFVIAYISIMRARRAISAVVIVTFVQSVATIALMEVLLRAMGINGVGLAWLIVQTAIAVYLLLGELRTLWLPYVHPGPLRSIAARARLTAGSRPRRGLLQVGADTLDTSGLATRSWELDDFLADRLDVCKFGVRSSASGDHAILKVATSERGSETLRAERVTLRSVHDRAPRACSDLVPRVREDGSQPHEWTLETRCDGVGARPAVERLDLLDSLLADVVERVGMLYGAGAAPHVVDEAAFARLVDERLAATEVLNTTRMRLHSDARSIAKVREGLRAELIGANVTMTLTHGNLWLGNVLWEPRRAKLTGLVDWYYATVEPPAVDVTHLLCVTRATVEGRELGAVVRDALEAGSLPPRDEELIASLPGAGEISTRTALLLAWLRHISNNSARAPHLRAHQVWLEHNVHQVLEHV